MKSIWSCSLGKCAAGAPPVRFHPNAPWPGDLRLAVAPALGVAASARVRAAGQVEVEQRLAHRLVDVAYLPASTSFWAACSGGLVDALRVSAADVAGDDAGLGVVRAGAQRLVVAATLGRDLERPDLGDQRLDLLVVQRAAAGETPRRHRRERPAVDEDELDLALVEAVQHGVERRGVPLDRRAPRRC